MPALYAILYVAAAAVVVVLGYDLWAVLNNTPGDTISAVIQWLWELVPAVALWWGAAGGHFTSTRQPLLPLHERWVILVWTTVVVIGLTRIAGVPNTWVTAWIVGTVGWALGALLLPQPG